MEYSDKVKWLKRYRNDLAPMISLINEAKELRSISESISINWSGLPGGGDGPTKVEKALEAIEGLLDNIQMEREAIETHRAEILRAIDSLADKRERDVLRYLYINGFSRDEVSARMGYAERYVYQLQRNAIEELKI